MVSTFTPNINLEMPARGDYVGTWDTPVNGNESLTDLVVGGAVTINAAAGSVVLSAAQFQSELIIVNSTLTASITLTFPTTFTKPYTFYHNATGSSAFTITLRTTSASGNVLCGVPGEYVEVHNLGATGIIYKSLGRIGSYMDLAGSSLPAWISGCTLPPYLLCDGTTFSSALYPQLTTLLGSTTLPDARGRARFALDGGVARLTSAVTGFSPNTVGAAGGDQNFAAHTHGITDAGHTHGLTNATNLLDNAVGNQYQGANFLGNARNPTVNSAVTGITINTAGTGTAANIPPAYVGGITLIRAA